MLRYQINKGFTLIELLVVIAIIAILAAILFPVFAQARQKARQITSLSNEKQLGLAFTQYIQDYDETYPMTDLFLFGAPGSTWVTSIFPYVNSTAVFTAPEDSGPSNANFAWCGTGMSYSVNGYQSQNGTNQTQGVVGLGNSWATSNGSSAVKMSEVGQPSNSIELAELFSSDVSKNAADGFMAGNYPQNWPDNIFLGNLYYGAWGVDIPNDTGTTPGGAWPFGTDGGVTAHYGGIALQTAEANFLFCDGHTKTMHPSATNPDPTNHPESNMWNCQRQ